MARQVQPIDDDGRKWYAQRRAALDRDGHACRKCGRHSALEVHHIVGRSVRVDHSLDNLLTLCASCHLEQQAVEIGTNMTLDEWLETPHYNALVSIYRSLSPELRAGADQAWKMLRDLRAQEPREEAPAKRRRRVRSGP